MNRLGVNMIKRKNLVTLCLLLITILIYFYSYFKEVYDVKVFTVILIISLIFTLLTLYKNRNGLLMVYLAYLTLSCAGIPIVELFTDGPLKALPLNTEWYYLKSKDKAILISYIFITIYSLLSVLFTSFIKKDNQNIYNLKEVYSKKYFILGMVLSISFFVFLIFQFVTGNLPLFSTYQYYFSMLSNIKYYPTFIFLYAVAVVCIFASSTTKQLKLGVVIILLPGILLLLTGNRGELLYPVLAGVGVLIIRGVKLNYRLVLILSMIFFILIPLIKEVRNLENINEINDLGISLADPFLTIGYTLRPIVFTVDWIDHGEDFIYGESFYVPVQRGIANNIPKMKPIDYYGKPYNYRERLPTMGYSIIAETYHNFGILGSFLVAPVIVLLLLLGEAVPTPLRLVISGGIAAILINNIRNAFSFVPGQIVMLLLLLIIYNLLWNLFNSKNIVKK